MLMLIYTRIYAHSNNNGTYMYIVYYIIWTRIYVYVYIPLVRYSEITFWLPLLVALTAASVAAWRFELERGEEIAMG